MLAVGFTDSPTPTASEGELAQMVERSLSMREVAGSMPAFSKPRFYRAVTHKLSCMVIVDSLLLQMCGVLNTPCVVLCCARGSW